MEMIFVADPERTTDARTCDCGILIAASDTRCWLCGKTWGQHATVAAETAVTCGSPWQFGVKSLFLMMGLCAVLLGVIAQWPDVGIPLAGVLAVLLPPALLRTSLAVLRRNSQDDPMTVSEKIFSFLSSLIAVIAIGISAFVGFYPTAILIHFGLGGSPYSDVEYFTWILGFLAGGTVGGRMAWWLWPYRKNYEP